MDQNNLYPVFLKPERLHFLIVGGGHVGLEKLGFLLKSSPNARVTLVASRVLPEIRRLARRYEAAEVIIHERPFRVADLRPADLVVVATSDTTFNRWVRHEARARGKLVNVADKPDLCDFYMGAIVTRGPLKVAISTQGKAPMLARRFREMLEQALPDRTEGLLHQMERLRHHLQGSFAEKVARLEALTATLVPSSPSKTNLS